MTKKNQPLPTVPDGFNSMARSVSNSSTNQFVGLNENSEFDLEESEFNNIDKNEQKEIY